MKLYVLSDNSAITERWISSFAEQNPIVLDELTLHLEPLSLILALDSALVNFTDAVLKQFFQYRVMVLSLVPDFDEAQKFLALGAMGYGNAMMHESHLHSVHQALEEGKIWLYPDFITLMITQMREQNATREKSRAVLDILSNREREVALMLGDGATHQEISDGLDITIRTVKAHATAIYQKLDVKDRLALSLLLHT